MNWVNSFVCNQVKSKFHENKSITNRIAVGKQMQLDEARRKAIENHKTAEMHLENVSTFNHVPGGKWSN